MTRLNKIPPLCKWNFNLATWQEHWIIVEGKIIMSPCCDPARLSVTQAPRNSPPPRSLDIKTLVPHLDGRNGRNR
ncbi:hypothetical protein PanWU01x14_253510 [Parasponia andersonii]|uniref:Uncharacterized protein n=1 Tax=Parasponia andersonii TaxID=3476 RepID=A0A2P5BBR4_PARAD|nr:hypothetical protein PanWU01x14_253510 [Parasponia andersonii]